MAKRADDFLKDYTPEVETPAAPQSAADFLGGYEPSGRGPSGRGPSGRGPSGRGPEISTDVLEDYEPPEVDTWGQTFKKVAQNFPDRMKQFFGGWIQRQVESPVEHPSTEFLTPASRERYENMMAEYKVELALAREKGEVPGQKMYDAAAADLQANQRKPGDSFAKQFAGDAAMAIAEMVPVLAVSFATRTPAAGALLMAEYVGGHKYGESRAEGRTIDEARIDALFHAVAEGGSEMIPLGILMKSGGKFLPRVFKASGAEAIQEGITEILQSGYDIAVIDETMRLGEAVKTLDYWKQVSYASLLGATVGGTLAVVSHPLVMERKKSPGTDDNPTVTPAGAIGFAKQRQADLEGAPSLTPEMQQELDMIRGIQGDAQAIAEAYALTLAPAGAVEQAGAAVPELTQEDLDSPIANDDIIHGKQLIQEALAGTEANKILAELGLPAIGSAVNVEMDEGPRAATVLDVWDENEIRGLNLGLEDGTVLSEPFDFLEGRITEREDAETETQETTAQEEVAEGETEAEVLAEPEEPTEPAEPVEPTEPEAAVSLREPRTRKDGQTLEFFAEETSDGETRKIKFRNRRQGSDQSSASTSAPMSPADLRNYIPEEEIEAYDDYMSGAYEEAEISIEEARISDSNVDPRFPKGYTTVDVAVRTADGSIRRGVSFIAKPELGEALSNLVEERTEPEAAPEAEPVEGPEDAGDVEPDATEAELEAREEEEGEYEVTTAPDGTLTVFSDGAPIGTAATREEADAIIQRDKDGLAPEEADTTIPLEPEPEAAPEAAPVTLDTKRLDQVRDIMPKSMLAQNERIAEAQRIFEADPTDAANEIGGILEAVSSDLRQQHGPIADVIDEIVEQWDAGRAETTAPEAPAAEPEAPTAPEAPAEPPTTKEPWPNIEVRYGTTTGSGTRTEQDVSIGEEGRHGKSATLKLVRDSSGLWAVNLRQPGGDPTNQWFTELRFDRKADAEAWVEEAAKHVVGFQDVRDATKYSSVSTIPLFEKSFEGQNTAYQFTPSEQMPTRKYTPSEMGFTKTTTLWMNTEGDFSTNGQILDRGPKQSFYKNKVKHFAERTTVTQEMADRLFEPYEKANKNDKLPVEKATIVHAGPGATASYQGVLLEAGDGAVRLDRKYYDHFRNLYPKAEFQVLKSQLKRHKQAPTAYDQVWVVLDGKAVAVIMPTRQGKTEAELFEKWKAAPTTTEPAPTEAPAKTYPQPNEHGVYPKLKAEKLSFSSDKKARPAGRVSAHALEVGPGQWVAAASFDFNTGNMTGSQSPLSKAFGKTYGSRNEALRTVLEGIRSSVSSQVTAQASPWNEKQGKAAGKMLEWINAEISKLGPPGPVGADILAKQDFGDLEVTYEAEVDETGETFEVTEKANVAFRRAAKRRTGLEALLECVGGS